jgi:hypothetical protein
MTMAENIDWADGSIREIPPELIAQLAEAVRRTARRYEMMGRPRDAVRVLQTALTSGRENLRPQDMARLTADLGGILWRQGYYQDAVCGLE